MQSPTGYNGAQRISLKECCTAALATREGNNKRLLVQCCFSMLHCRAKERREQHIEGLWEFDHQSIGEFFSDCLLTQVQSRIEEIVLNSYGRPCMVCTFTVVV